MTKRKIKSSSLRKIMVFLVLIYAPKMKAEIWKMNSELSGQGGLLTRGPISPVKGEKFFADLLFETERVQKEGTDFKFSTSARFTDSEYFGVSIKDLWYQSHGLKIGFQELNWSESDNTFAIGTIDRRRGFSGVERDTEGRPGVSYQLGNKESDFLQIYGSPIYLPSLSLNLSIEQGEAVNRNAWSEPYPESLDFNGTQTDLYYELLSPDISEVVFQPSIGIGGRKKMGNLSVSGFYMWRLEDQAQAIVNGKFYPEDDHVRAKIYPLFYHAQVAGFDISYEKNGAFLTTGLVKKWTQEDPSNEIDQAPLQEDERTIFHLFKQQDSSFWHASYSQKFPSWFVRGSFLKMLENPFVDEYSSNQGFFETFQVDLEKRFSQNINAGISYLYDLETEDLVITHFTDYAWKKTVNFRLGFNLISSVTDESNSYWWGVRDRDSLYGRVSVKF